MPTQFKPGNIVKFKISNQKMIVKALATKPSQNGRVVIEDRYECVWHDGTKNQKAVFHKDALEPIAPYYDSMHFANFE
jgi:uncharacterized protein YodC (DUF2158 family)